jgi:hypothetical protein
MMFSREFSRNDGFKVSIDTIGKKLQGVYCEVSSPVSKYGLVIKREIPEMGNLSESFAIKTLRTNIDRTPVYVVSNLSYSMNGNLNKPMRRAAAEETLLFLADIGHEELYCPTAYRPYFERVKNMIFKDDVKIPANLNIKTGIGVKR